MTIGNGLLKAQIAKANTDGRLDVDALLRLVESSYEDFDRDRRRNDRANRLMAEEIEESSAVLSETLRALALQNMRFQAALDNMQIGLCLFDSEGLVAVCNNRFGEIYGIDEVATLVGQRLDAVLEQTLTGDKGRIDRTFQIAQHVALDSLQPSHLEQHWPDGRVISISRAPVDDGGYLDTVTDITERRGAEASIARMANFDALTGLPNRVLFQEKLNEAVSLAARGYFAAVLCLDLDRFKSVNDTLGHPVGDALLQEVTRRLNTAIRSYDMAARLGGDEFAVIVSHFSQPDEVTRLATRLIAVLSKPYFVMGYQVLIGASIGIEYIWNDAFAPDDILRNADLALYQAKAEGKGRFAVYNFQLHDSMNFRRELELDLRRALVNEEFAVYYQPQISSAKDKVCGFEALVRWNAPGRGIVSPAEFVGLCEEIGLIAELGEWVLRRACSDAVELPADVVMAVNVSPLQLQAPFFAEMVKGVLSETGLPPERLELEITESAMISEPEATLVVLNALKGFGVRISLDDFGTGFSSLGSLRQFPFDKVKIDQSFVRNLGEAGDSLPIVQAVSDMCRNMGIVALAEGVETQQQYDILKSLKCSSMQGYLFGRPTPIDGARAIIESKRLLRAG